MQQSLFSIVVPCYNEEGSLKGLVKALDEASATLNEIRVEYILVDDGSRDGTLEIMRYLAGSNEHIRYISFSRNFGKEAAMFAGMEQARGDYVCIMDADLQDRPELLPELYGYVSSGEYDCAAVRRVTREGEPVIRSFFARAFYRLMGRLCDIEVVDGARDYRVMSRRMTDSVLSMRERNRFSKGLFAWVGYRTKWVECVNSRRAAGESKWSFFDLLVYAIDGLISFSTKPLALSSVLGVALCALSFIAIIVVAIRQLVWGGSAYGWTSLVCIILLLFGLQLLCVGILGQYLAKMFIETKARPIYIIRESSDDEKKPG